MNKKAISSLAEQAKVAWDAERENAERINSRKGLLVTTLAILIGLGFFKVEWVRRANEVSRIEPGEWNLIIRGILSASLVVMGIAFLRLRTLNWLPRPSLPSRWVGVIATVISLILCLGGAGILVWLWQARWSEPAYAILGVLLLLFGALNLRNYASATRMHKRQTSAPVLDSEPVAPPTSSHFLHLADDLFEQDKLTEAEAKMIAALSLQRAATDLRERNYRDWARMRECQVWFAFGLALLLIAVLCYLWTSIPPIQPAGADGQIQGVIHAAID